MLSYSSPAIFSCSSGKKSVRPTSPTNSASPVKTPTASSLYQKLTKNPDDLEQESFQTKAKKTYLRIVKEHPDIVRRLEKFPNRVKTAAPANQDGLYVFRRKGKQMRPLLVFLTAKLNGGTGEPAYIAATLIELLHTASLVHDDVVDDAAERRGALSVNALWNSKIAVLVGDYMLSKGLLISIEKNRTDMLEITSEAVKSMTEAELLQLQKSRKLNLTEEDYFRIIRGKTAALYQPAQPAEPVQLQTTRIRSSL